MNNAWAVCTRIVAAAVVLAGPSAWAATGENQAVSGGAANLVWSGGTNSVWDLNTSTNWNGDTVTYLDADDVTFDDTATRNTVNLVGMLQPAGVTVDGATSYIFQGAGGLAGPGGLTKSGSGTLTIATTNTFTGATVVLGGTLRIGAGGSSGWLAGGGPIEIRAGATNIFYRSEAADLSLAHALSGDGTLLLLGTGTLNQSRYNPSAVNTAFAGRTVVDRARYGIGNVNLVGSGSIAVLSGGQVFASAGTYSNALSLAGNGWVETAGTLGALRLAGNSTWLGAVTLSTNSRITAYGAADSGTVGGVVSGPYGIEKTGSGVIVLTATNAYTGATTLGAGTLRLSGGNNRLPNGTTLSFTGSSTLDVGTNSQTVASFAKTAGQNATIAGSGGTLTVNGAADFQVNAGTLTMSALGNWVYNRSANNFRVGGTTDNSTANAYLAGSNTVTAATVLVGCDGPDGSGQNATGVLYLGQNNTLNAGTIRVLRDGGQSSSATLRFNTGLAAGPTLTIRGSAGGSSRATMEVGWATEANTDYAGGSGTIDLTTGVTGSVLDALVSTLTLGNHANGAGNFNNATSGTFTFGLGTLDATSIVLAKANAPNNKTSNGTLTVSGGTVKAQTMTFVEDSGGNAGSATFNINSGAHIYAQTIGSDNAGTSTITWNNGTIHNYNSATDLTINLVTPTRTFNLVGTGLHAFDIDTGRRGAVNTAISGTGSLTKTGAGTLVLGGANVYGGTTTVAGGTLLVNGANTGTGAYAVGSGILGGGGQIAGAVTVASGAVLAPGGTNAVATFTVNNAVTISAGGVLHVDIRAGVADRLALTGDLRLQDGALLTVALPAGEVPASDAVFTVASGSSALTGTFKGLPNGQKFLVGAAAFRIRYNTSAIPPTIALEATEPGSGTILIVR